MCEAISIVWAENNSSIKTFLFLKHSSTQLSSSKTSTTDALYSLMFPDKRLALNAAVCRLTAAQTVLSTHCFRFENVLIVTVSVACSVCMLTKLNATSVNSLTSDEVDWSQSMSSRVA